MSFISFSFLVSLAKTSTTTLNQSGKRWYFCLVPDLEGRLSAFHHYDVSYGLGIYGLYYVEVQSFYIPFVSFIINGCWIMLNAFSVPTKMIMIFILDFVHMYILLTDSRCWIILASLEYISHLITVYNSFNVLNLVC